MAEKSVFYNAFPDSSFATGYDRNYNADDISDWFSIVCSTGVLKGGLAVSVGTGLSVNVAAGKATIQGKGYVNNAVLNLTLAAAPTGANPRYDLVILRMDNTQTKSARRTYLYVKTGTSTIPAVANVNSILTRNSSVYELLVAYVAVQPNAQSITQITDCRGNATWCPWFVAVKGYDDYYDAMIQQFESNVTLSSASNVIVTDIPSLLYNSNYSLIEVYSNGLKEENTDYTIVTSSSYVTIRFTSQKAQGSNISVVMNNFINGEGLNSVMSQYTDLVEDVATLKAANSYTYVCNGQNDNIGITNMARDFLNGGTDYGSMKINVVGTFGYSAMAYGDGTSANPYRLFNLSGNFNRRIILDFTNCSPIVVNAASGKYTVIFATQNLSVISANIQAYGTQANTTIKMFSNSSGYIRCESCRFWLEAYSGSNIAATGTFIGCRASVLNVSGASYCFQPADASLLRVEGGEFYAYTGDSSGKSAIVGQSNANAVSILYGINAPTQARSGYYQTYSLYQVGNAGWMNCTDLVSELPLSVVSGKSNIRGTIALSKAGGM